MYDPLVEEGCREEPHALTGELSNGATDPGELTDVTKTAWSHFAAEDLRTAKNT